MALFDFTDKVVLVTGSSSGIGEGAAVEFARLGAHVVVTGRNGQNLCTAVAKCQEAADQHTRGHGRTLAVPADITKDDDLRRLIETTITEFGQLDVLVNNAGVNGFTSIFDPAAVSTYERIMGTNLRSVFVLTHLAMPHLVKTKGCVVNVSSTGGTKPFGTFSAYGMTKAALDMFTQCLALEVGPHGVRVNCVKPGLTRTNIFNAMGVPQETADATFEGQAAYFPLRRIGTPEDIANVITFLASDKTANMTGSLVVSDGGSLWAARPDLSKQAQGN